MIQYMVTGTFHKPPTAEILALVPRERARIKELMEQGPVREIHIAANGSAVWIHMQRESESAIREALETLPLHPYMSFEITALAAT